MMWYHVEESLSRKAVSKFQNPPRLFGERRIQGAAGQVII